MERTIIITKDGSHSISIPEMNVTYHSVHGAIRESVHVFIESGFNAVLVASGRFDAGLVASGRLAQFGTSERSNRPDATRTASNPPLKILEMGFGTGLNSLLTLIEADKQKLPVHYTAIELFPLISEEIYPLNYCEQLNRSHYQMIFEKLHQCEWEQEYNITPFFTLHKISTDLFRFFTDQLFNLIYFDAFAPAAQPELWTKEVFEKLYNMMADEGTLVTYCSKGEVRRAMQAAGFKVEKIQGPPGKREMLRARK